MNDRTEKGRTEQRDSREFTKIEEKELVNLFQYHKPNADQKASYETIRLAGRQFAETILRNSPKCADQSSALRSVRQGVTWAIEAIAVNEAPVGQGDKREAVSA